MIKLILSRTSQRELCYSLRAAISQFRDTLRRATQDIENHAKEPGTQRRPPLSHRLPIGAKRETGFETHRDTRGIGGQAAVLGVGRSTAWWLLNHDKRAGPSAKVIKRILLSPQVPKKVRLKVEQYVEQKIRGLYGHSKQRTQWFGDQFHIGHRELKPKH